jgi:hypothetical protein
MIIKILKLKEEQKILYKEEILNEMYDKKLI